MLKIKYFSNLPHHILFPQLHMSNPAHLNEPLRVALIPMVGARKFYQTKAQTLILLEIWLGFFNPLFSKKWAIPGLFFFSFVYSIQLRVNVQ